MRCIIAGLAIAAAVTTMSGPATGQTAEELRQRVEALERQVEGVEQMRQELDVLKDQLRAAEESAAAAKQQAATAVSQSREAENAYAKWHLAGYASAGFVVTDNDEEVDTFLAGSFNPIFHFQYKDLFLFESELEIEVEDDGETAVEVEYATLDLLLHDYATLKLGKFLSPIGQFQQRLHPAWINKLPDAPAGFGHGGVQPLSDVGVMLTGGFALGPVYQANYAIFAGNGPRFGHHGPEVEGFGEDNNSDKSIGGRIGILPIPHLEIGASFMRANVEGEEAEAGPVTDADYYLWGVDASYTKGPFDIRFEYLQSSTGSLFSSPSHGAAITELIPSTDFQAWYVQGAYQLSNLTNMRFVRNLEPVVRYGQLNVDGFERFERDNEKRLTVGLNYLLAPSIIAKLAVSRRDFEEGEDDATEFRGQLAYGF